ncbi:HAMP domain-containing protein [Streptomyces fagopyri]|uniref:histidine kinase n=1 Tax=Streptomyces fagopyri TaxID=2662397 RepID=A0A5Q0LMG3_9ACTN|nr:sensor histidine kinase [Streptomyces fagopyri]QFZ78240.1 HAMP domain-containing protein [Streptomyces fagopyri]
MTRTHEAHEAHEAHGTLEAAEARETADKAVTRRSSGVARLTVQGWIHVVLAVNVLLVIVFAVSGGVLQARADDRTDLLTDGIQPARSAAFQLETSLVDQETGVRGYVLSTDTSFLEPYESGVRDEAALRARLSTLLTGQPRIAADLRAVQLAGDAWRRDYARPLIESVRTGGRAAPGLEASKAQFDETRNLLSTMETHLGQVRDRTRASAEHARDSRNLFFAGTLAAFLASGLALTLLLHRIVGRPLRTLEAASVDVSGGAFERMIRLDGPRDLEAVARAVEEMRRRIVEELSASMARETLLEQRTAELDAQALELKRSNAELEQFAYVASHDLQEPLRKVASFCQLLEKRYGDRLDDRAKQYIDFAVDGAKRMQTLINDLLTFSRVGRVGEKLVPVALDDVLDRALGNLSVALDETGARVVREGSLPTVTGDATTLTMLWQNLIGNAVKFRDPGRRPEIVVRCEAAEGEWRLGVRDNGIGIESEFREKVFVIFQRLHGRDEYDGTGIGLAVCRKIVEHHGGIITLEGAAGEGTDVSFTLPMARDEPDPRVDETARPPEGART